MSIFHNRVPDGFKYSPETVKALKKRDEVHKRLRDYTSKNADCRPHKRDVYNHTNPTYFVPALIAAERQLRELEIKAAEAGKPMPDREAYMAPVKARVAEYKQTAPALKGAAEKATEAAEKAIHKDMNQLAGQALKECDDAQAEYRDALDEAEAARLRMSASVGRFLWAVSGSTISQPSGVGWVTNLGADVDLWESTDNGTITHECAKSIGLIAPNGTDLIELSEFVAEDETQEVMTPIYSASYSLGSAAYSANGGGFM